jgi:hypothetical protein
VTKEDILRPKVTMSEVERFEESDGLSEVVHPFLPQRERFQLFYFGNHHCFFVSDKIVFHPGSKGYI